MRVERCISASRPMMCFRLFCSFIKPLLTGILSDAEVLLTLDLAPDRATYPIGGMSYGWRSFLWFVRFSRRAATENVWPMASLECCVPPRSDM